MELTDIKFNINFDELSDIPKLPSDKLTDIPKPQFNNDEFNDLRLVDCGKDERNLCNIKECYICYNKSFVSVNRSKYLLSTNSVYARGISKCVTIKLMFKCENNHTFILTPAQVTGNQWCPNCPNIKINAPVCKELCGKCKRCFKLSFASNILSKYWSPNNEIVPGRVGKQADKNYLLLCQYCDDEYLSPLKSIKHFSVCYRCSDKSFANDPLSKCGSPNKSFESNPLSKYWSPNNKLKPHQVNKLTKDKFLLICQYCNIEYKRSLQKVTYYSACDKCNQSTENVLYKYLSDKFKVENEVKFDWCKNEINDYMSFDFLIEDLKIIIELDGIQHFEECNFGLNPNDVMSKDVYKMCQAIKNGYSILRISQRDISAKRIDLNEDLLPNIITCNKPRIIFISSNENLYKRHYFRFLDESSELYDIDPENIDVIFINE